MDEFMNVYEGCKRASLAESSGFTPRMTAVMLFNRHCESQARKPGLARQRAVTAHVGFDPEGQAAKLPEFEKASTLVNYNM